jgi:hypothetical protein
MNKNPEEFQKELNMLLIEPFLENLEKIPAVDIERDFKLFLISINYKNKIQMDIRIYEKHIDFFWFDKDCKLFDNDSLKIYKHNFKLCLREALEFTADNILELKKEAIKKRRNLRRH